MMIRIIQKQKIMIINVNVNVNVDNKWKRQEQAYTQSGDTKLITVLRTLH